jgi:hypothetical protein
MNNLENLTNTIATKLNPYAFRMQSSFRSLSIYQLFGEIVKLRGKEFIADFDIEDHVSLSTSVIRQLEESVTNTKENNLKEVFILGLICGTLVHINMPVPEEFDELGNYAQLPENI